MKKFGSMPNFRRVLCHAKENADGENPLKLYRSSRPDLLSTAEAEEFKAIGIRCIIDFRSVSEYRKATGDKPLDAIFPVYKVTFPFKLRYKPGEDVRYVALKQSKISCRSDERAVVEPKDIGIQNNVSFDHLSKSSTSEETERAEVDVGVHSECTGKTTFQRKHFLVNFFKINYTWAVFNRAPWYLKLYSLLFLLYDVVFNTGYKYFVRLFARHVLNKEGLLGQYTTMITYSHPAIYAALKLLTDPDNVPAMLNCAHGKDRTGIVTALVLSCLGMSNDFIARDYAQSEGELESMRDRLHEEIVDRFHMCQTFTTAKYETMMNVLQYIEQTYGSIPLYLESIGFGLADQEELRRNLQTPVER